MKIYQLLTRDTPHSDYHTESLHLTRKGALKAMLKWSSINEECVYDFRYIGTAAFHKDSYATRNLRKVVEIEVQP